MFFWVKDKLAWKVFLHQVHLNEWNQIHEEILRSIPDNIAVYDFNGSLLFENKFFRELRESIDNQNVLEAVKSVKKRDEFGLTPRVIISF